MLCCQRHCHHCHESLVGCWINNTANHSLELVLSSNVTIQLHIQNDHAWDGGCTYTLTHTHPYTNPYHIRDTSQCKHTQCQLVVVLHDKITNKGSRYDSWECQKVWDGVNVFMRWDVLFELSKQVSISGPIQSNLEVQTLLMTIFAFSAFCFNLVVALASFSGVLLLWSLLLLLLVTSHRRQVFLSIGTHIQTNKVSGTCTHILMPKQLYLTPPWTCIAENER